MEQRDKERVETEVGVVSGIHRRHGQGEERLQLVCCCSTRGGPEDWASGSRKLK